MVDAAGLRGAVIEEFALGPSINLNFFYSPLLDELELMGTDTRRQTNLEGLNRLPFAQAQALADEPVRLEEAGHVAATLTESMLEAAFEMGERFVRATQADGKRGIIGPFALQCIIVAGPPKDFVVYDVSLRIPGSPGTRFTPYAAYRWGRDVSVGERIAMEVIAARDAGRLAEVLT
jgi:5-formaminoimidazole-4-carboxamide-1-(beta)-D-ribofuranosyl 5'-monophosphate synthetase